MTNLKDIIIDEGKRIGVSLIPWACIFSKKHHKIMSKNNDNWIKGAPFTLKNRGYIGLNVISTGISLLSVIYFAMVADTGSWNPSEWWEIQKQEEIIMQQNDYRNQFYALDLNKDSVIDSTEFIYRK